MLSNERPKTQELPINPMEDGLEIVSLSWIQGIEKFQQLYNKLLVDELLGSWSLHFWAFKKPKEESIHKL